MVAPLTINTSLSIGMFVFIFRSPLEIELFFLILVIIVFFWWEVVLILELDHRQGV